MMPLTSAVVFGECGALSDEMLLDLRHELHGPHMDILIVCLTRVRPIRIFYTSGRHVPVRTNTKLGRSETACTREAVANGQASKRVRGSFMVVSIRVSHNGRESQEREWHADFYIYYGKIYGILNHGMVQ